MSVIQIQNLSGRISSSFSSAYVADQITMEIDENSTIGILGESGSGKTQLAMTLAGLNNANYQMERGSIHYKFNGLEEFTIVPNDIKIGSNEISFDELQTKLTRDGIYGNRIGFMFQDPGKSLNPYWTIGRHFKEILNTKKEDDLGLFNTRKEEIYRALKLDIELDNRYPNHLSGGQQQRVVVALVLISEPEVIIADEIATGVDASVKRELLDYLLYVKHLTKSTLLIITHDIGFLLKIADKIILMYKGAALQSLDADIIRSVILSAQFINQDVLKSKESIPGNMQRNHNEGFDSISQQLHPYLRGLLSAYIYNIPLEGDIPDPTKPTGEACPFAERCSDRMDECSQTFPLLTTKPRGWVRCLKFEEKQ